MHEKGRIRVILEVNSSRESLIPVRFGWIVPPMRARVTEINSDVSASCKQ